jgi:sulfite exporter TauE/SafE
MNLLLVFLAGLTFSGHCLAMCGPFPAALRTAARSPAQTAGLQLLYHLGKITTYLFLGVLAASAGLRLDRFQRPFGLAAGALLLIAGAAALAPAGVSPRLARWLLPPPLCNAVASLIRDGRPASALTVGLVNGFLPCPLVYGMLAYVATLGSLPRAALSMIAFGLGTVPALALLGLSARFLRGAAGGLLAPSRLARLSGLATALLGCLAIWRALTGDDPSHLHHLLGSSLPR